MGDDKAVLRKIRFGQLQGGAFVVGSLTEQYLDLQIYGLPLLFNSYAEVDYVRERMDPIINKGLEEGGFVSFGLAEGGFAYMMSQEQVNTIDDLRKSKVWIPDNDKTILEAAKVFELRPIPLALSDVLAGLQTGLVNTVATSPIGALALQWHTQVKYLLDLPFMYIMGIFAVDKKAFDRIPENDREVVRSVLERVFKEIDKENRKDNVKAMEALLNQGIQKIIPSEEVYKEWEKIAAEVPDYMIKKGKLTPETYNKLKKIIKEYRSKN
jgi:TRAP-type C4-dicarboxylate transport system substrate-binding protein